MTSADYLMVSSDVRMEIVRNRLQAAALPFQITHLTYKDMIVSSIWMFITLASCTNLMIFTWGFLDRFMRDLEIIENFVMRSISTISCFIILFALRYIAHRNIFSWKMMTAVCILYVFLSSGRSLCAIFHME